MAKAKGKSTKKDSGMPKKVAGVKVPKELRKGSDSLSALITSPLAREVVADALIAIAGALAGNKKARDTVTKAGSQAGAAVMDAGAGAASATRDLTATATGAVAEVVTEAARKILPTSLVGGEPEGNAKKGGGEARYAHLVDTTTTQKKKKKDAGKTEGL